MNAAEGRLYLPATAREHITAYVANQCEPK
jgi:hypothetical protein